MRSSSVDKVAVIELGDIELAKHATAQLREYFQQIKSEEVEDVLEVPLTLQKVLDDCSGCILLIDSTDQRFTEEVVSKVLDIETDRRKPIQKLIVEKDKESRQAFRKRSQEAARENAEKLAGKIENTGSRTDYEEI